MKKRFFAIPLLMAVACAAPLVCGCKTNPVVEATRGKGAKETYEVFVQELNKAVFFDDISPMIAKTRREQILMTMGKEEALRFVKTGAGTDVTVVSEKVEGNHATLEVTGKTRSPFSTKNEAAKGVITLVQEEGVWKFEKGTWKPTSPPSSASAAGSASAPAPATSAPASAAPSASASGK